ncbi:MAG TPA: hypothetical protein VM032_09640 [Vicinamibacterales bacterium]|nr:hypothetical protein [Vicinamibacterales bacterium]
MTKYLAGVLSVIAVGVLLVAYGLLNPRGGLDAVSAMGPAMRAMPMTDAPAGRDAIYSGNVVYVPVAQAPGYAAQPAVAPGYVPVNYVPQAMTVQGPVSYSRPVTTLEAVPVRTETVSYQRPAPRRASSTRYVERAPRRDWKRTALIIGGSSATGAGVGAIFGGKKGALIGAAIAGGASTIYQTVK